MSGRSPPLRVGIIGANWSLLAHAPAWRMVAGIEVAAVCTSREDTARAAAERSGIDKAYWDVGEMVADPELDIIDIGTKPQLRFDMVMRALKAGKHVYNCLPFATDLEHASAMRDEAEKRDLVTAVDAQWRWTPAVRLMKEMIEDGAIGEFYTANLHLHMPLFAHDGFVYTLCAIGGGGSPYPWLAEAASGASAWRNFGSHAILCLMPLFGEVEEIVAASDTFVKEMRFTDGSVVRPETADFASAILRFRNGGMATISVSWAMADAPGFLLEACGSKGRIAVSAPGFNDPDKARLHFGEASREPSGRDIEIPDRLFAIPGTAANRRGEAGFLMPFVALFENMTQAIRDGGRSGSPSFAEATHAHAVVEAAVRSERTRSWEKVPVS